MHDKAHIQVAPRRAAQIVEVDQDLLARWVDLVQPSVVRFSPEGREIRLYDFAALTDLALIVDLRNRRVPMRTIRQVVANIRDLGARAPLRECAFAVDRRTHELYFRHDGVWSAGRAPTQGVIPEVIDLEAIRRHVHARAIGRDAEDEGRTVSRRGQLSGRECFEGTRIPVSAVVEFIRSGASDAEILDAYPRLTHADLALVRNQAA